LPLARSPYTVALMVILAMTAVPVRAQTDWQRFTHPTAGFSLSYPPGWEPRAFSDPAHSVQMMLGGPPPAGVPKIRMAVIVISVPTTPNVTAEELLSGAGRPLRDHVDDLRIMRVDHTTLDGNRAAVVYGTANIAETDCYVMILLVIAKSRGYLVTGVTALDSTNLATETRLLQTILASFRLGTGSLDPNTVAAPESGQRIDRIHN
jgi:predicted Zn-dependent protease